jgi:hypothetical protein
MGQRCAKKRIEKGRGFKVGISMVIETSWQNPWTRRHGSPGLLPLLPDHSTSSRPRAVDTISDARPTRVPCSVGLPGGVKESRADGTIVGECDFCASTDAGADVGGAGTARDT